MDWKWLRDEARWQRLMRSKRERAAIAEHDRKVRARLAALPEVTYASRRGLERGGRTEDGNAMPEYLWLISVIAIVVVIALVWAGPKIAEKYEVFPDCPTGWSETWQTEEKKNETSFAPGCVKDISGEGEGNTGKGRNVKGA